MHITDGVLSTPVSISGYIVSAAIISITVKNIKTEDIPKISILTAAFFVASLIHIPVPPISIHLIFNGLVGIILHRFSFISIFIGLILQSILFQHGGILSIGINSINLGLPALFVGLIFYYIKKYLKNKKNIKLSIIGSVLSAIAIIISTFLVSVELILTGLDFKVIITTVFIIHLFVAIIEGILTFLILSSLLKIKPDII